jgi:hypothetical protein
MVVNSGGEHPVAVCVGGVDAVGAGGGRCARSTLAPCDRRARAPRGFGRARARPRAAAPARCPAPRLGTRPASSLVRYPFFLEIPIDGDFFLEIPLTKPSVGIVGS